MILTTNIFFIFTAISLCVYYLVPKKAQWLVLLIASYLYYAYASFSGLAYLLYATVVSYVCARVLEKHRRKWVIGCGIILDLAMLVFLKYTNFIGENMSALFHGTFSPLMLIVPLGISYYTLQTVGYMLDVYWKREQAQHHFLKYALFVSFFPQALQGPIGRYGKLKETLFAEHTFTLHNIKLGLERIIWGLFKKMMIGDWASIYREAIFSDLSQNRGLVAFGLLFYAIELYCDFSGGIDVALGVAELFGITLGENFKRPYFSKSISEFWRRWHVSLGQWMKEYVFYPLTLSKGMTKLQKALKRVMNRKTARNVIAGIATFVVFFLVGLWHEATWITICWGLYNGLIIGVSGLLPGVYARIKKVLHISEESSLYQGFMILRTFVLVCVGWGFSCVQTLPDFAVILKNLFTHFSPALLLKLSSGNQGVAYTPYALITIVVGCILVFVVSVIQEKGVNIREALCMRSYWIQVVLFLALLILIPMFSPMGAARGFIYAQF